MLPRLARRFECRYARFSIALSAVHSIGRTVEPEMGNRSSQYARAAGNHPLVGEVISKAELRVVISHIAAKASIWGPSG